MHLLLSFVFSFFFPIAIDGDKDLRRDHEALVKRVERLEREAILTPIAPNPDEEECGLIDSDRPDLGTFCIAKHPHLPNFKKEANQ